MTLQISAAKYQEVQLTQQLGWQQVSAFCDSCSQRLEPVLFLTFSWSDCDAESQLTAFRNGAASALYEIGIDLHGKLDRLTPTNTYREESKEEENQDAYFFLLLNDKDLDLEAHAKSVRKASTVS